MGFFENFMQGYSDRVLGPENGTNTSANYEALQQQLTSKYNTDKAAFEADPNNKGKSYQMPDPVTRWGDQIDAMIKSGDPALVKAGIQQMQSYQENVARNARGEGGNALPSAVREYQFAQGQGYQGSFQQWQKEKAAAGRSAVNVSVNSGEKWVPLGDLAKFTLPDGSPIPPGTTMEQLAGMNALPVQTDTQRQAGTAGDVLTNATNQMGENINAGDGTASSNLMNELRTNPSVIGQLADAGLSTMGVPMRPEAVKFNLYKTSVAQQTVKIMSGASATEGEMATYRGMLPRFTDDAATRQIKFKQAQEFADSIIRQNRKAGVKSNVEQKQPEWNTTKGGHKYRIVE